MHRGRSRRARRGGPRRPFIVRRRRASAARSSLVNKRRTPRFASVSGGSRCRARSAGRAADPGRGRALAVPPEFQLTSPVRARALDASATIPRFFGSFERRVPSRGADVPPAGPPLLQARRGGLPPIGDEPTATDADDARFDVRRERQVLEEEALRDAGASPRDPTPTVRPPPPETPTATHVPRQHHPTYHERT